MYFFSMLLLFGIDVCYMLVIWRKIFENVLHCENSTLHIIYYNRNILSIFALVKEMTFSESLLLKLDLF